MVKLGFLESDDDDNEESREEEEYINCRGTKVYKSHDFCIKNIWL